MQFEVLPVNERVVLPSFTECIENSKYSSNNIITKAARASLYEDYDYVRDANGAKDKITGAKWKITVFSAQRGNGMHCVTYY